MTVAIWWIRRDLGLINNPALIVDHAWARERTLTVYHDHTRDHSFE